MSRNYYSEINLHLTWHTKTSLPLITDTVELLVHHYLREKAEKLGGIEIHEIGGIPTHIHLAISIQPTVTISEMVGALKGYTSHAVNHQLGRQKRILEWQTGYGVVSFGTKDIEWVLDYIRRQKEHHARGAVHDRLERIEFDETPPVS